MKCCAILFILILEASFVMANEIQIENNTIYLGSLSLEQKIAQMFIIRASEGNIKLTDLNVGGIYVSGLRDKEKYKEKIEKWQNKSKIKLLVATDLEGWWNPFPFARFPNLDEINTSEEAYKLGEEHGELLKELGFNMNFAPVAEIEDNVWEHRAFKGNVSGIKEKVRAYVSGLQKQGIMATLKHYPGGSLNVEDPHKHVIKSEISKEQLEIFNSNLNVSAIMIGHAIVFGVIDSKGKPSTVSKEVISNLRENFSGLIITDDIKMKGLRKFYPNEKQLLIELVNSGNDIILGISWQLFPGYNFKKKVGYIKKAVENGRVKEETINTAVKRILQTKGYNVII